VLSHIIISYTFSLLSLFSYSHPLDYLLIPILLTIVRLSVYILKNSSSILLYSYWSSNWGFQLFLIHLNIWFIAELLILLQQLTLIWETKEKLTQQLYKLQCRNKQFEKKQVNIMSLKPHNNSITESKIMNWLKYHIKNSKAYFKKWSMTSTGIQINR
jgi:hypothetical protein